MLNGIAVRAFLSVITVLAFLSGCARDRAGAYSSSATAHNEHASSAPRSNRQRPCPVSGEPLESMGGAIPVTVNGETIHVCCRGCVDAVNEDPDKYLAIVRSER